MNERYLPICTHCYAVRVEPQRARALRPTCAEGDEQILLCFYQAHTIVLTITFTSHCPQH